MGFEREFKIFGLEASGPPLNAEYKIAKEEVVAAQAMEVEEALRWNFLFFFLFEKL